MLPFLTKDEQTNDLNNFSVNFFSDLKPVCHNKGLVVKESEGVYSCQCKSQYTGPYCESG